MFHIQSVCDDAGVPHPTIFSESGRAIVSYHSVLVFNTLGVSGRAENGEFSVPDSLPDDVEQPLRDMLATFNDLSIRNVLESFHDAQQALDMTMHLFGGGYMPLEQRAMAEKLFWAICNKIHDLTLQMEFVPEDLDNLDVFLSETYFCNFSLFQSMPDSWAIKQLFPILPIHRLEEKPTQRGVLCDVTCDSDGRIDRFIDRRDVKRTLALHPFNGQPYYLGAFLIGAYQEILGDLHNLFGDTNAVHVTTDAAGRVIIQTVIGGDTVREVLQYVEFDTSALLHQMRSDVDEAVREQRLDDYQAARLIRFYEDGLNGYTYLEEPEG